MDEPSSLATHFIDWADQEPDSVAWTFSTADGDQAWTRRAMADAALRTAEGLIESGAQRGDLVLLSWPTSAEFVAGFWGCQLAGASVVPVPIETTGSRRERSDERLDAILSNHPIPWALAPAQHREVLTHGSNAVTLVAPTTSPSAHSRLLSGSAEAPALVQFTSGSTLAPRGCLISPAALLENALALGAATDLLDSGPNTGVNWCPLFHDMGLVTSVVLPVAVGDLHAVLMAPERFAARPSRWLELLDRYQAVVTVAPNAALALVSRWAERSRATFDLSHLATVATGAEPVDPEVVRRFTKALAPWGLVPDAVKPAYGLAEATVGVTLATGGLRTVRIDRAALETASRAVLAPESTATIEAVSVGRPLRSIELRIMTSEGAGTESTVGDIQVRTPSRCDGYLHDEHASAALWDGEWLRTGDVGFVLDGDLFIVGRAKDTLVVAGRNIAPQDVERIAERVDGVRPGTTVAFASEHPRQRGTDRIMIVIEGNAAASDETTAKVRSAVHASLGLVLTDVVLVGRGEIPRTTSGKVRRQRCRELFTPERDHAHGDLPRPAEQPWGVSASGVKRNG